MAKSGTSWEAGQSGNAKGRPPKEREVKYYAITMSTCTFADWKEIIQKAVKQAKGGDAVARKFLADHLVGVPEQTVNVGADPIIFNPWGHGRD